MSTPGQKEEAATQLRGFAEHIETLLDPVPGWSRQAWQCPAADNLEAEAAVEATRLGGVADTLRGVAASLDAAAAAQRAAEAAEAAAVAGAVPGAPATIPGPVTPTPLP